MHRLVRNPADMTLSAPCMLVIGRNGQVATALQEMGGMTGRPIVALGRKDIDILSEAAVTEALKAFDPQVIVNTAAYTAVDQAEDDKDAAYALNAEAAGQIARACERLHKPLIHLSTDYVFGTDGAPFREGDPTGPINVYGASKLEGERLVREACEQSLILRTSWVSGAHGRNFIKSMIRLSRQREVLTVVDDQRGRTLINDAELPGAALEVLGVADEHLVRGDQDLARVALAGQGQERAEHVHAILLRCAVDDRVHAWRPLGDLVLPSVQRRGRADDHERAGHLARVRVRVR